MKTYEPMCGEKVSETAEKMVALANKSKQTVTAKFNDITLTAKPGDKPGMITTFYSNESSRRSEEYKKSPAGKKAAREAAERVVQMQQKYDALLQQLPDLDFTSYEAVLNWLCEFQDPSDHIGVTKQTQVVLKAFTSHGYKAGVNTGDAFDKNDCDNVARYIIGQALSCLQSDVGAVHQVIHSFTEDWKKKFLSSAA
jgi:hypothetical protein